MTAVAIVGEQWEAPFASYSLRILRGGLHERTDVLVPPELRLLGAVGPVTTIGSQPGRFRSYDDIVADMKRLAAGRPFDLLPAGSIAFGGDAVHAPPAPRRHRYRRLGAIDVWTVDTGDGYFAALTAIDGGEAGPVWSAYGAGCPVFTVNTNEFLEPAPARHEDYFILASGLLGLRMVLESDPGPDARVIVFDINPDQLAWCRFVIHEASTAGALAELEHRFRRHRPDIAVRAPLPHELDNVGLQVEWYQAHRLELAELPQRVQLQWVTVDLLSQPAVLLSMLSRNRSVFFMYLDLFVVWHVHDDPPWIVEFPDLAHSLEREVRRRSGPATFLPGPGSRILQIEGSPLLKVPTGGAACT